MFKCNDCNSTFHHPKTVRESMGEHFGFPSYEFFDVCPVCGSEDWDELNDWDDEDEDDDENDWSEEDWDWI